MGKEDYSYNTGKVRSFQTADYVLFIITLVVSAGIGVVFAIVDRRRNTTKDFLLGGKKMHVVPVSMSLTVTFMSALTLLGNPAEIYNYHTMFWYLCAAFIVALFMAAYILIPFFYSMGITSTFEYLELRFSRVTRVSGCALLIIQTTMMSVLNNGNVAICRPSTEPTIVSPASTNTYCGSGPLEVRNHSEPGAYYGLAEDQPFVIPSLVPRLGN